MVGSPEYVLSFFAEGPYCYSVGVFVRSYPKHVYTLNATSKCTLICILMEQ